MGIKKMTMNSKKLRKIRGTDIDPREAEVALEVATEAVIVVVIEEATEEEIEAEEEAEVMIEHKRETILMKDPKKGKITNKKEKNCNRKDDFSITRHRSQERKEVKNINLRKTRRRSMKTNLNLANQTNQRRSQ